MNKSVNPKIMALLLKTRDRERDEPPREPREEPEREDPRLAAADELLMAIRRGDPQALVDAFETLFAACSDHGSTPVGPSYHDGE